MPSDPLTTSTEPADELTGTLKRTVLQRSVSSIPGREIVQVLTEIPVGVESGWHVHPGEEVGFIVAGTVSMRIKDRPTLTLHAGDPFLIPPRVPAQRARPRTRHGSDALHLHRRGGRAAVDVRGPGHR
jgi:quercetin dioxygenase-like cupin family protein